MLFCKRLCKCYDPNIYFFFLNSDEKEKLLTYANAADFSLLTGEMELIAMYLV